MKKIPGYTLKRTVELPELRAKLRELTHDVTRAQILHIENEDNENVFCFAFQTTPSSSNGVAHILEHTVLCGSKKYPVKDPFFAMNRRSLNTFMNAMTGSDFTCYPAASQIPKDFYNLLSVYVDAAFRPLLKELSFKQEGWRLEFQDPANEKTPLEYKGIVYNEMKGALSSSTTRLIELTNESLFPDITYGVNSGGDPKVIPKLTYDEFKKFHEEHYNPGRCLFYFYGNLPLEKHLKFLDANVFKKAKRTKPLPAIPKQKRHKQPVVRSGNYSLDAGEVAKDKGMMSLGWLTCPITDQKEVLALSVLDYVLMDTDASLLKRAILKSELSSQAGSFVEGEIAEVPYVMIFHGCKDKAFPKLEKLVIDTLREIVQKGIPPHLIENALHQMEISRSEIGGGGHPFGLSLFFRSALFKMHGGKPEYGLLIHSLFKEIRDSLKKDPRTFEKLITRYLLDNPHRVRVDLLPSSTLAEEELKEEATHLAKIKSSLSSQEIKNIKKEAKELALFQKNQENQDIEVLPKLTLKDVPKKVQDFKLDKIEKKGLTLYHHDCFTNGITYADLVYKLPKLSREDLPYVRLMAMLIPQLGMSKRSYAENLEYIQANTGGIEIGLSFNNQADAAAEFTPTIHFMGKSLRDKTPKLFGLINEMITSVDFSDKKRLNELLKMHYTGLEATLSQRALRYAINLAASGLSAPGALAHQWFGLGHYAFIQELIKGGAKDLSERLEKVHKALIGNDKADLILTADEKTGQSLEKENFYGLNDLPKRISKPWDSEISLPKVSSQGRVISSQVAFTCRLFKAPSYTHPDASYLNLASFILSNTTLHPLIREKGGAYGGGASNSPLSGTFHLYAYRDPHIHSSLEAFSEAIQKCAKGRFEEQALEEAKLELVQGWDTPTPPGQRGETAYSWLMEGRTKELRQEMRDRALTATKKDIANAVKRQLLANEDQAIDIVLAGRELLVKENKIIKKEGEKPLLIKPVV